MKHAQQLLYLFLVGKLAFNEHPEPNEAKRENTPTQELIIKNVDPSISRWLGRGSGRGGVANPCARCAVYVLPAQRSEKKQTPNKREQTSNTDTKRDEKTGQNNQPEAFRSSAINCTAARERW